MLLEAVTRLPSDVSAIRYVLPIFQMTVFFYIILRIEDYATYAYVSSSLLGGGPSLLSLTASDCK